MLKKKRVNQRFMGGIGGTLIGAAKVINWLRQLNRSVLANRGKADVSHELLILLHFTHIIPSISDAINTTYFQLFDKMIILFFL